MADKDVKIGAALAAATCSLLGIGPSVSVAAEAEPKWDIDSAFLYYGESDGRVTFRQRMASHIAAISAGDMPAASAPPASAPADVPAIMSIGTPLSTRTLSTPA